MVRLIFFTLVRQPIWEKENSELKPVKLHLKIDLVLHPVHTKGLVNTYYLTNVYFIWRMFSIVRILLNVSNVFSLFHCKYSDCHSIVSINNANIKKNNNPWINILMSIQRLLIYTPFPSRITSYSYCSLSYENEFKSIKLFFL